MCSSKDTVFACDFSLSKPYSTDRVFETTLSSSSLSLIRAMLIRAMLIFLIITFKLFDISIILISWDLVPVSGNLSVGSIITSCILRCAE